MRYLRQFLAYLRQFLARLAWAHLYLSRPQRRLEAMPPERFAALAGPLVLLGFAAGLLVVIHWHVTLKLTWGWTLGWKFQTAMAFPSAVAAMFVVIGIYRQCAFALINLLLGRFFKPRWARWALVGCWLLLAGLVAVLCNAGVRHWDADRPTHLPPAWQWLWPAPLYRVLLLMPLWGAWAMLVLVQFHRPAESTDPPTRSFADGVWPIASAMSLLLPLAGSLIYLKLLYPWHFVPAAAAIVAALAGGSGLVRLNGQLSRNVLLAANLLTQLTFLATYVAVQ